MGKTPIREETGYSFNVWFDDITGKMHLDITKSLYVISETTGRVLREFPAPREKDVVVASIDSFVRLQCEITEAMTAWMKLVRNAGVRVNETEDVFHQGRQLNGESDDQEQ